MAQDLLVSQMVMVEFLFVNKSSKFYNNYLGNPMAWIAYFFLIYRINLSCIMVDFISI